MRLHLLLLILLLFSILLSPGKLVADYYKVLQIRRLYPWPDKILESVLWVQEPNIYSFTRTIIGKNRKETHLAVAPVDKIPSMFFDLVSGYNNGCC